MTDLPGRNFAAEELQARVTVLEAGLAHVSAILNQKKTLQNLSDARLDSIITEAANAIAALQPKRTAASPA